MLAPVKREVSENTEVFVQMKRVLTIAAAAAALALPALAVAQAARTTHVGHLVGAPEATVKFKEKAGDDGASRLTSFAVSNFTVACKGDVVGTLDASVKGSLTISDSGAFRAVDDNGKTLFKADGQINRNKSLGSFRYSGRVEADDGQILRGCDTGKTTWVTRP
jgi:hypothetical protein